MKGYLRKITLLCLPLLILAGPQAPALQARAAIAPMVDDPVLQQQPTEVKDPAGKTSVLLPAEQFKGELRRLWMEHAFWTRSYMVSAVAGMEDQEAVLARLMNNQQDMGEAIKPFYGENAGKKLVRFLREHVFIYVKLLDATKKGHREDAKKYEKDWYRNAQDIAAFLSKANPNWPYDTLQGLLNRHLDLMAADLNARLAEDWQSGITASDQGKDHLIKLADVLADGIVKQFPEKFGAAETR